MIWDELRPGTRFDTDHERGCVVVSAPTDWGSFEALDSDGVVCSYGVAQVTRVLNEGDPMNIKDELANELKSFVCALAGPKGFTDAQGRTIEMEYGHEDKLSCGLRVRMPDESGSRYFEFRVKEMQ